MEKQFNHKDIDERFKDEENMPSIQLWSKIEQTIGPNNAARIAALRQKYSVYRSYIAYAVLVCAMIYPAYVIEGVVTNNPELFKQLKQLASVEIGSDQHESAVDAIINNDYSSVKNEVDGAQANLEDTETITNNDTSKSQDLSLISIKPEGIVLSYDGPRVDDTSYFVPHDAVQPKWQINVEGGADFTKYAMKQKSALFNTESAPNNAVWRFGSFENQAPIVVSIGLERNITKRLSIRGDISFYHMKGTSMSNIIQGSYIKKSGELNMAGLSLGPEYSILNKRRVKVNLGASISAIHTDNSLMTYDRYENGELIKSKNSEVITASSALFANTYTSVEYAVSKRLSISAKAHLTRPLHNFVNELNVYNNGMKYIGGARVGVSFAI